MAPHSKAFTLIELLVVVTIIVVLLSLLAPAMDRAVYRAELVICATRLKTHATSATLYAIDHKRHYLDRAAAHNGAFRPDYLAFTSGTGGATPFDDRVALRPYMSVNKMFNCPFVQEIDYDAYPPPGNPAPGFLLYTSVNYWYGWRFTGTPGLKGMMRIGDRVEWKDTAGTYRFNVLANDIDTIDTDNWSNSAHPDRDGFLVLTTARNDLQPFVPGYCAFSYWGRWGITPARGKIDQSFAYEDGSAETFNDVVLRDDERLQDVAGYISQANSVKTTTWLPKR